MTTPMTAEKTIGRVDEQGLLFEYTIKLTLFAGLLELILYRLTSRLGMHFSKVAQEHESVRWLFKGLSSIGFVLLNVVALLVFLALGLLLVRAVHAASASWLERAIWPPVALLLVLTLAYVVLVIAQVEMGMLASVAYNAVAWLAILLLVVHYLRTHPSWSQRIFVLTFFFGISGWLYFQIMSTTYGVMGIATPVPLVHEISRGGEALMVLASILSFVAFGAEGFWSRNRRQRRRVIWFGVVGGGIFLALFFIDFLLGAYDPEAAFRMRKAGEGISWIFQMGMGYTFYLPFALYLVGLLCWSYTVIKLVRMGRLAGYGVGLMFTAGYALQLSHLTLMVVLGLILLGLDRLKLAAADPQAATQESLVPSSSPLVGTHS